ncbi:MAG: hypothetical protein HY036_04445 [Nitrospirae bacterium]|nr:hypothetical protein [Nitrospirota bacterium]
MRKVTLFLCGFISGIVFLAGCGKTDVAQSFAQAVIKAIDVVFDNRGTHLASTNVQDVLNEINTKLPNYVKPADLKKLLDTNVVWYGSIRDLTETGTGSIPFSIQFSNATVSNATINNILYAMSLDIPDDGIISFLGSVPSRLGSLINVKLIQRNGTNYLTGVTLLNNTTPNTAGQEQR